MNQNDREKWRRMQRLIRIVFWASLALFVLMVVIACLFPAFLTAFAAVLSFATSLGSLVTWVLGLSKKQE